MYSQILKRGTRLKYCILSLLLRERVKLYKMERNSGDLSEGDSFRIFSVGYFLID